MMRNLSASAVEAATIGLGLRLRVAREAKGLSQQALGRSLGGPQSLVSMYELGQRKLIVPEFIAVARALDLEPATLLAAVEADG
jgi:transcriptional regulator with XRE-family HTH domain